MFFFIVTGHGLSCREIDSIVIIHIFYQVLINFVYFFRDITELYIFMGSTCLLATCILQIRYDQINSILLLVYGAKIWTRKSSDKRRLNAFKL